MKRVRKIPQKVPDKGDIILSKSLRDFLLTLPDPSDIIGLYIFYLHTANWQNSSQPRATDSYCMKALGMGKDRFQRAKKALTVVGLIKQLRIRGATGAFEFYVKVNHYYDSHSSEISPMDENKVFPIDENGQVNDTHHSSDFHSSDISRQMLNHNNKSSRENMDEVPFSAEKGEKITPPLFEKFWIIYPKKKDKGKTRSRWNRLCSEENPPLWRVIKSAIRGQINSERWKSGFIPDPYNWLDQGRWEDDPKEMISFSKEEKEPECLYGFTFGSQNSRQGCLNCEDENNKMWLKCRIAKKNKENKTLI